MTRAEQVEFIRHKYTALAPLLNERTRRCWAATEAQALGYGGISIVAEALGIARGTIHAGLVEVQERATGVVPQRVRRVGGGRQALTAKDPMLVEALNELVEPTTRGDPQSPLRWRCKSTTRLARELKTAGHPISQRSVGTLLHAQQYSLQANRKTCEGSTHPDRDAQFQYINTRVQQFQHAKQPVISVDTKKKELVGNFKAPGHEWQPNGKPEKVSVHDFADPQLGKVMPYGVYDLAANAGWVNVGIDHDTAEFAVESIRRWWMYMGQARYPQAKKLLITADCGGSNGSRARLWKVALQQFADDLQFPVHVCHFPPGTSKWNKIEHRLFCFITQNWRGRPLLSRATVVNLIAHTTTQQGLTVRAMLDERTYKTGKEVTEEDLAALKLKPHAFHGEWNYCLLPRPQSC
jgi:Rhodopirellula transposase DDE domain